MRRICPEVDLLGANLGVPVDVPEDRVSRGVSHVQKALGRLCWARWAIRIMDTHAVAFPKLVVVLRLEYDAV